MWKRQLITLMVSSVLVSIGQAGQAESKELGSEGIKELKREEVKKSRNFISLPHHPTTRLRNRSQPATTVKEWMAQVEAATVQVTNVKLERTATGLDITLETAEGEPLQVDATKFRSEGNSLIADIPNAVLALPQGQEFVADNPTTNVANVRVVQQDGSSIRVSVTGNNALPKTEVTLKTGEVAYSLNPDSDEPDEEIVVTGERANSEYFVPDASSTLKTDVPLRDTPTSIQVVPQKVIEDQGATSVREVVRNTSGVNLSFSGGNRSEQFVIRGFDAENGIFRNGFRDDFLSTRTETELANIDRVEVLKGPASVLFGRADPAGIINFATKKPLREPFYEIAFTAGSFDFYRPTLDFSGSLTENGNLAYRLNAAYENAGSFRDGVKSERFFVAPTLSWQTSDNTKLTFEFSYLNDTRPIDRGLVILSNNKVADIPISTFLGDPDIRADFEETRTELYLDHRFNHNLSLRSLLRYTTAIEIGGGATSQIVGNSEDDRNFPVAEFRGDRLSETFTIQNDLVAKFNTGSLEHTVLFGLEYFTAFNSFRGERRPSGMIDIFNASAFNPSTDAPFELLFLGNIRVNSFGIYLQDQITILDNLKFVIGGRFDTINDKFEDAVEGDFEAKANAFSPRVGIVYQPIEPVSLYASYTRSFTPTFGTDINGELFEPQRGKAFEIGVKTEIIKDRLFSTLAFYNTTLTNVTTEDPANPDFEIQTGEQNSRGIELDIAGDILPGWKIFAGYAYTDAAISKDNVIPVGNRLVNVPEHKFNLWTTYTLQKGSLAGLGFGLGVFYVDKRAGDLDNSFFVDAYTRVDAAIYYEKESFRAALNFKNLFDSEFIEGTRGRRGVEPGAPFTVLGTVSVRF